MIEPFWKKDERISDQEAMFGADVPQLKKNILIIQTHVFLQAYTPGKADILKILNLVLILGN